MAGKFEVHEDTAGKFRWRLKSGNGQVVASGQGYDTKAAAVKGVHAVQRAAQGASVESAGAEPTPKRSGKAPAKKTRPRKLIKIEKTGATGESAARKSSARKSGDRAFKQA